MEVIVENTNQNAEKPKNSENYYSAETINLLSDGVLNLYKPELVNTKNQLNELTEKQSILVEQLHNENLKLSWSKNLSELHDTFNIVKSCQARLLNIKRDMRTLHERTTKLKKRATRLQQHKDKETYLKNQKVKLEQDLIARSSKTDN